MTANPLPLLLGLFGVPVILMVLGHRLRGRTEGHKHRFWGGVTGYVLGIVVAVSAMLLPPVVWIDGPFLRPFLVHWAMLLGGAVGIFTGPFWVGRLVRRFGVSKDKAENAPPQ